MPKQYGTPGQRSLWPSIATSVPLARCSVWAQLLFERLISQADDQGRQQGEPVLVAAACMPLMRKATPKAIEKWIEELVEAELILWYQSKREWLIQIRNWWDHQSGQRWVYPSRWPAPRGWDDRAPKTPPVPESFRNGAGIVDTPRAGIIPASATATATAGASGGGEAGGGSDAGKKPAAANGPSPSQPEVTGSSPRRGPELAFDVLQRLADHDG